MPSTPPPPPPAWLSNKQTTKMKKAKRNVSLNMEQSELFDSFSRLLFLPRETKPEATATISFSRMFNQGK